MVISRFVSLDKMASFAKEIVEDVFSGTSVIVLLRGTLGAGKTTFSQHLARVLGVQEAVQSPTYTLVREYPLEALPGRLVHMDLYRLSSLTEVMEYGIFEYLGEERGIYLIEWPELIEESLDTNLPVYDISLQHEGEGRQISISQR